IKNRPPPPADEIVEFSPLSLTLVEGALALECPYELRSSLGGDLLRATPGGDLPDRGPVVELADPSGAAVVEINDKRRTIRPVAGGRCRLNVRLSAPFVERGFPVEVRVIDPI